ncbi:preprotein translocase subunit SecG [bacterium]|nr:preprotein translocase subunit SecG [bacterium]
MLPWVSSQCCSSSSSCSSALSLFSSSSDSVGGIFAGGSQSAFGSRSSNIVIKITYVLGALFFVTAFSMALINKSSTGNIAAVAAKTSEQTTNTEWWKADTTSTTLAGSQATQTPGTTTTVK